jgi:hypothetical protein
MLYRWEGDNVVKQITEKKDKVQDNYSEGDGFGSGQGSFIYKEGFRDFTESRGEYWDRT